MLICDWPRRTNLNKYILIPIYYLTYNSKNLMKSDLLLFVRIFSVFLYPSESKRDRGKDIGRGRTKRDRLYSITIYLLFNISEKIRISLIKYTVYIVLFLLLMHRAMTLTITNSHFLARKLTIKHSRKENLYMLYIIL